MWCNIKLKIGHNVRVAWQAHHVFLTEDNRLTDFSVICKVGMRKAFKITRYSNVVKMKHKTKSGTLAEHFTLDLRFCLPFSISHDRMSRSSCQYSSVIVTGWLWTLDPNTGHHQKTTTCLFNHTYVSDLKHVLTENMLRVLRLHRPNWSHSQE
jgi:hypothetical protein